MRLGRADFEAVLEFLADVDDLDDRRPYPRELLERMRRLIPSAVVSYQEADLRSRRFTALIADDVAGDDASDGEDDDLYWRVGPCPIADYRSRTGDLTPIRMSDLLGRVRWHEQPVYREYFAPVEIEYVLDLGLAAGRDWYRSLVLLRERDESDFSERDRAVVELLRPHLRAREARAELQAIASGIVAAADPTPSSLESHLTMREREILAMVADGRTNAQIAAELWITPATVKKHLENVYVKLGVGSRAAAATRAAAAEVAIAH